MTSESIQNFLDYKNESYSNEFVKGIYNLFSVIFKYLMEKQYLCCNPMDHVSPPISYRKAEFEVYSPERLNALLERLRSTAMTPPVMIGIHLGVRTGECYALRWSDFDLDSCTVTISKQLQYQNGSWSFVPPKYEFCHRTLTFTGSFKQYLMELKKMQELLRANSPTQILPEIIVDRIGKKEGYTYVDDFVCLKPDGRALNANSNKVISRITSTEMGYEFRYDNLRFTHAVWLAAAGCTPRFIMSHMGYGKLQQAYNLYDYITEDMEAKSRTAIENFFG